MTQEATVNAALARPRWVDAAINLLERVLATYFEALLGLLLASGPLDLSAAQAAAIAAVPAALAVLSANVTALTIPGGLPFYVDMAARAAKTAIQTFLGFLIAAPVFGLDRSLLTAAAAAVLPAVLAVVKAALATRVGDHRSAALRPAIPPENEVWVPLAYSAPVTTGTVVPPQ